MSPMQAQPEGLTRKRRSRMDAGTATDEFDIWFGKERIGHTYRTEARKWLPVSASGGASPEQPFKTHNEAMGWLKTVFMNGEAPGQMLVQSPEEVAERQAENLAEQAHRDAVAEALGEVAEPANLPAGEPDTQEEIPAPGAEQEHQYGGDYPQGANQADPEAVAGTEAIAEGEQDLPDGW